MGEVFSSQKNKEFLSKIEYFQSIDDANLGKVDVFRMCQPPFQYVMDFKKTFIENNQQMNKYLQLMGQLKNLQHKNLAKLHACQLKEDKQLCIIHKVVHTYCNYYNFTLAQAIQKKKATKNSFNQSDLIYILHSLCDLIFYLHKYNLILGQMRSSSIFLSPQGHIKACLLDMDSQNRHSAYYRVLSCTNKISEYNLSPQQLVSLKKMEYEAKFDLYKSQIFSLGMVMLELISLDWARFYYNEEHGEVMINKALFSLEIYQGKYSKGFLEIIKRCLEQDPSRRLSPEQLLHAVEDLRAKSSNIIYCIRLQAEENKDKKEDIPLRPKGQFILNSLAKKLNPSPISTISSSSASLLKSVEPRSISFREKPNNHVLFKE